MLKTDAAVAEAEPLAGTAGQAVPAAPIRIDDSKVLGYYSNFCRVTGTPEEVVIDFGLNTNPMGTPSDPITVAQRLVMNFYTAKRLYAALGMTLQRHEGAFGVLETNVQRRVVGAANFLTEVLPTMSSMLGVESRTLLREKEGCSGRALMSEHRDFFQCSNRFANKSYGISVCSTV